MDAFDGLLKTSLEPAVQPGHDAQLLLFGQLAGDRNLPNADRVDGVRLFHEHVLARLHRLAEIHGVVLGRAGNQHDIGALDHVPIPVQAGKTVSVIHLDLVRLLFFEQFAAATGTIGEDVGHGHKSHAGVRVHGVQRRPRAASAATDQANLDDIASGRVALPTNCSPPKAIAPVAAVIEVFRKSRRKGAIGCCLSMKYGS